MSLLLAGVGCGTGRGAQESSRSQDGAPNTSLTALAAELEAEQARANESLLDLGERAGLDQELLARLTGEYEIAAAGEAHGFDDWPVDELSAGLSRFADPDDSEAEQPIVHIGSEDDAADQSAKLPGDSMPLPESDGGERGRDIDATPDVERPEERTEPGENPVTLLRQRIEAEGRRAGTPFYEAVLSVLLDLYADGTTKRYVVPTASQDLDERELAVLSELQIFVDRVHRDVYRRDSIEPLVEAALQMAAEMSGKLPLTIPKLVLCKRVDGFGQYEPLAGNRFLLNRPHRIGVYAELENFTSRRDGDGLHRVEVSQTLTLYNEFGTKAWQEGPRRFVDASRNRRRDFFLAVAVDLPVLSVGTYNLKVSMRDENSGSIAERSVEIQIVADPRLTSVRE